MRKTVFGIMLLTVSVCMLIMAFSVQCVKVSDAATATGGLSATISPSVPVVTVNSAFVFTANVAGGTPPYQYNWTLYDNLRVPVAYGIGNPWNCAVPKWAFVGTGNVTVYVTDSQRKIGFTSKLVEILAISLSVSPDPPVTLDVGQSQVFNSLVLGGTTPFSYQWYLDSNPVSGATSATWTYTPSSAGFHTVYLKVTDAASKTVTSNTESVTVNAAPSASISPNSVTLDVGQSRLFTSTVTGGTSPYSYQWYLDGAAVSGAAGSSWTYTPSAAGSHPVYMKVADAVSAVATSNTATITVNRALSVTILPTSVVMDVGQSKLFTSTVTGGTSPYSYQWYLDGAAVSGAAGSSWTYTPSAAGSHTVYAKITDHASSPVTAQSNTANVTVNAALFVAILSSSSVMDVGQSQNLSSSISGGTASYSYQWYLNGSPVLGATNPAWTFTPLSATSYTAYLKVTDNVGMQATSDNATATVNSALSVDISPIFITLDVGQSQTFTTSVAGGTSPNSYQWYLDGSAVSGATSPSWSYSPSVSGLQLVYVKVTDSASTSVTAQSNTASVTVNSAPSITISFASAIMDVGQSQQFTSSMSGGTSPCTYQWYLNGTAINGATSSSCTFTPSSRGHYNFYCNITDNVNAQAQSNTATVVVSSALSVSISPSSVVLDVGESQLFNSTVSGGTSPFSCQWYLNGVAVSGAANAKWTFASGSVGSYTVYLNVTDSADVIAISDSVTITVNIVPLPAISPSSATTIVGQSQLFTSIVSGGVSPYTYQWYVNGAPISGAINSTWTITPTLAGTYTVCVKINDSVNVQATSNSATVNVRTHIHDITVTNVTPSETAVLEGNDLNINITVANLGDYNETFNVTLYGSLDGHRWSIYTFTGVTLAAGSMVTLTINDLRFGEGLYTFSVQVYSAYVSNTYTGVTAWVMPNLRRYLWGWQHSIPV